MSHTITRSRHGLAVGALALAFAALVTTTAACGTQQGTDIQDTGSSLSGPRHGAVKQQETPQDATSANLAEHLLEGKKFSPPPAGMRVPD